MSDKQTNVTYLLGAGASANAFPVVKEMGKVVKSILLDELEKYTLPIGSSFYEDLEDGTLGLTLKHAVSDITYLGKSDKKSAYTFLAQKADEHGLSFFNDLNEVSKKIYLLSLLLYGCETHLSVDTYAKKLWLGQKHKKANLEKYNDLRTAITLFFQLHNNLYKKIEKRYDAFFAGIMDVDKNNKYHAVLPDNVNIISWNYDYSLESSLANIVGTSITSLKDDIVHYKGLYTHNINSPFKILKLNGVAGTKNGTKNFWLSYFDYINNDLISEDIYDSLVSFAWDDSQDSNNEAISLAKQIMAKTDILVVIGYSFPLYNRKIDGQLLSKDTAPRLRKIYIQDSKASDIKETIDGFRDNWRDIIVDNIICNADFRLVTNTDQFYMPHEL
jgi:hypothetical protein